MGNQGDIWLNDLVVAIHTLAPRDDQLKETIAGLLGFNWRGRMTDVQVSPDPDDQEISRIKDDRAGDKQLSFQPPKTERQQPLSTEKSQKLTKLLEPFEGSEVSWGGAHQKPWKLKEPLEKVADVHLEADPPYEPLLDERWKREILAAAAATRAEGRHVDTRKIVNSVAKGRPLDRIPYLPRRTLVHGVQLLIDHGVGMEPFQRDQEEFSSALKAVMGESRVEELIFSDCPSRGCLDPVRWDDIKYPTPKPGTPVIVLSDLGIGGPVLHRERPTVIEWTRLAMGLKRLNCSLLAFLPYPKTRWRKSLRKVITHIPWDRSTSIGKVLELIE